MRAALTDFYAATTTPDLPWTDSRGWLQANVSVCDWFGVRCDANRTTVTGIVLASNALSSDGCVDLSPTLALLPDLTFLTLNGNDRLCLSRLDLRLHSRLRDLGLGRLGEPLGGDADAASNRTLLLPSPVSRLRTLVLTFSSLLVDLSTSPLLESIELSHYQRPFHLSSIDPARFTALTSLALGGVDVRGDLGLLCPMPAFTTLSLNQAIIDSTLPQDVAACWPRLKFLFAANVGLRGALPSFANLPQLASLRQ